MSEKRTITGTRPWHVEPGDFISLCNMKRRRFLLWEVIWDTHKLVVLDVQGAVITYEQRPLTLLEKLRTFRRW